MDPFERLRQHQQRMQMFSQAYKKHFPQYQSEMARINAAMSPMFQSIISFQRNFNPMAEQILKQQEMMQKIMSGIKLPQSFGAQVNHLYSALNTIASSAYLDAPVENPDEIFTPLQEMTSVIQEDLQTEAVDDLPSSITVVTQPQADDNKQLTWRDILAILAILLPIIVSYHIASGDDAQSKQQMKVMQQQIILQEEQVQTQQHLLEQFEKLVDHISQVIPENPEELESDQ